MENNNYPHSKWKIRPLIMWRNNILTTFYSVNVDPGMCVDKWVNVGVMRVESLVVQGGHLYNLTSK